MTEIAKKPIPAKHVFDEWQKNPDYVQEFSALEDEFSLASQLINARGYAGLTQQELAGRMNTSQAYIARLEGTKKVML